MELFSEAKGYATRKNAIQKLAKVFPEYEDSRYTVVVLPTGRFLPVVQVTGSKNEWMAGPLAHNGIGVM